jgi:hypothetical protein
MRGSMILILAVLALAPLTACASVTSADFDVVARPTECSVVAPQSADPQAFVRCSSSSTCVATPGEKTSCIALAVSGAEGDACSAQDECAPGLICSTQGGCLRACEVGSACADGAACQEFTSGSPRSAAGTRYGYCPPPSCDPLHPRHPQGEGLVACATDDCYFVGETRTQCFVPGGFARAGEGRACTDDRGCDVGFSCYQSECRKLCRLGGDDCGPAGFKCVSGASDVPGNATLLGESYGHCE